MNIILLIFILALCISFIIYGIKKQNKSYKYAGLCLIIIVIISDLLDSCNF